MIKIEGHTFNENWLTPDSLVIDIGGNTGVFSREILQRFRCKVVCYEPDRTAYANLEASLNHLPPNHDLTVVNKAVSAITGVAPFYSAQPLNGGNSLIPGCREMGRYGQDETYYVETISFTQALGFYDKVDLIKMDCEGAEFGIIFDTAPAVFKKIRQLTIEFHDFAFKQFTLGDVIECVQDLESFGFKSKYNHNDPDKDYYFWREDWPN